MVARRWTSLLVGFALLTPAQGIASQCYEGPRPTPEQLSLPAGVAEYREATTVSLVRFREAPQPPCWWIKLSRWIRPGAYPKDFCLPTARSRRHSFTLVEDLKGKSPARGPAVFAERNPVDIEWLFEHRPELVLKRPSMLAAYPDDAWTTPQIGRRGHSAFAFRHNGRISDPSAVLELASCKPATAPAFQTFQGTATYLVFRNAVGEITHWEMLAGYEGTDLLLERMRRLRSGQTDVRETISARVFFAQLQIVVPYEIKWCGPSARIRPVGGLRNGRIDEAVKTAWVYREDKACVAGQRFLVIGAKTPPERGIDRDNWPTIQLVPVTEGAIRTADIVTQLKIEGPETIPVAQALAWTD